VLFFAMHREIVGQREVELEVEEGSTVAGLVGQVMDRYPRLRGYANSFVAAVNREYVDPSFELNEGDEVALIPPVSGGSGAFRVTQEALAAEPVIEAVKADDCGAVVAFLGVVRSNSRGRKVEHLEYDAYPPMAEEKLAQIGEEILQKWGLDNVAIHHRIGHLKVGEVSLVIAVASPHREAAFAACQYAVDRIKHVVPIWKKEVWDNGEAWVEGESVPESRPVS